MRVAFAVPGAPFGKGRPRIGIRSNGRAMAFTPAKTVNYEAMVKLAAQAAMGDKPPVNTPVTARIIAVFPVPASWSKKRQEEAIRLCEYPTKKPDADNVCKAILDACNQIIYRDDSQVVDLMVRKIYGVIPEVRVVFESDEELENS
jgi:Holliday junction resolvase RusA-like endonuclease